ncbi:MAG TPA: EAL domain-containing protein [Chloroflexota bacterium]|nr:EAL domain-containing protein [Chloroflexota bacterium]
MRKQAWPFAFPVVITVALAVTSMGGGLPPVSDLWVVLLAVAGLVGLAFQLHRAQASARYHQATADAVSNYAAGAFCLVDTAGRIVSLSPAADRLLAKQGTSTHKLHVADTIRLVTDDGEDPGWLKAALSGQVLHGQGHVVVGDETIAVGYAAGPMTVDRHVTGAVLLLSESQDDTDKAGGGQADQHYQTLVEISPDGMILTDVYGYVQLANPRAAALHGFARSEELAGRRLVEFVALDDRSDVSSRMREALESGETLTCEYSALHADGKTFPAEAGISAVRESGETRGLVLVIRDISRHRQAEMALQAVQERTDLRREVADILSRAASLSDSIPRILEALATTGGWDAALFWQTDTRDDRLRVGFSWSSPDAQLEQYVLSCDKAFLRPHTGLIGECIVRGEPVWAAEVAGEGRLKQAPGDKGGIQSVFCYPLRSGGETQGVIQFVSRDLRARDATAIETVESVSSTIAQFLKRKQAERELEHRAMHDSLTDLPNRALFYARLERALSVASVGRNPVAVLLMDMDRFKEVNDTFGHLHGDLLLKQAAIRLTSVLRESDTVARLGGDEFAVLLPSVDEEAAVTVAKKILRCVDKPFPVQGQILDVGISVGIALYPDHGLDAGELLQHADVAMYTAKREKLGIAVYAADNDQHNPVRFALQGDLRRAIENGELYLVYQPKVDVRTGHVDAVEALARWHHPTKGMIPPDEFIPLAEQTGLIRPLTMWVLRDALRQLASWLDDGFDLRVAINLSAQNLHDPLLVKSIRELLDERGIEPRRLAVEVTESSIMVDAERARATLESLHRMGVRISIDDFGTGYSSLAYLHHLPTQEIKIDKAFVLDMLDDGEGAFIARSVIDLGHNFGLKVVAEGVENEETYKLLDSMECDHVQGYYLSPPLASGELTRWLEDRGAPKRGKILHIGTG